eukprot:scaffold130994_cov25-Tisochrysis_lutea.AAC.1
MRQPPRLGRGRAPSPIASPIVYRRIRFLLHSRARTFTQTQQAAIKESEGFVEAACGPEEKLGAEIDARSGGTEGRISELDGHGKTGNRGVEDLDAAEAGS